MPTTNTVDSVSYSDNWYKDEQKRDGGWTLEIIDPDNVCSEHQNWVASEDELGGTPGTQNSVFANKPDITGPKLLSAVPISAFELQLQFDEKLEKLLPEDLTVNIDPLLEVEAVYFSNPSLTTLVVTLADEIQQGIVYSINAENLYDCAGNLIQKEERAPEFGLPEDADSLDVLVNEILFNPRPTGIDFVEIINASGKFIDLKNWSLASLEEGVLKNKSTLSLDNFLLKPGGILAVTENPNILMGEYLTSQEQHFLLVNDLPVFNDEWGLSPFWMRPVTSLIISLTPKRCIQSSSRTTKEFPSNAFLEQFFVRSKLEICKLFCGVCNPWIYEL